MGLVHIDFQPLGDTGIRVQFHEQVSPALNRTIQNFCRFLEKEDMEGIVEWVPAYDTVSVYYLPDKLSYHELCKRLSGLPINENHSEDGQSEVVLLPTLYGGEAGPDLAEVAHLKQLSEEEVIDIHSSQDYLIYMMGFLPGYPYLGGLSDAIDVPRLANPRASVPAGSVGITGRQIGVYPLESPGGWHIIGRTPVPLFDMNRQEPFLYQPGDRIRFVPISKDEYETIEQQVRENNYKVKKEVYRHGEQNN